MDGLIKLPIQTGRRELCWYVGTADTHASIVENQNVPIRIEEDADFILRRLWLTSFPGWDATGIGVGTAIQPFLTMPTGTAVRLKDGRTGLYLSSTPGLCRSMVKDADPKKMPAAWLGESCPLLLQRNSLFYAEIQKADAGAAPWPSNVALVAEGFSIYPGQVPDFPKTIEARAFPYRLRGTIELQDPLIGGSLTEQSLKLANDGEGTLIIKGMEVQITSPGTPPVDMTDFFMAILGVQLRDTTSGDKPWVRSPAIGNALPICAPLALLAASQTSLPFNYPRKLQDIGVITINFILPDIAPLLAYIATGGAGGVGWPLKVDVSLFGDLIPK